MPYLIAAVVLVGVLCLLNMALCLGVIRRLREHGQALDDLRGGPAAAPVLRAAGETVADFRVRTVDGGGMSRSGLAAGTTLAAFFSLDCRACRDGLPSFVAYAGRHPGGADRVLAVVVGADDEGAGSFVAALRGVARVVRDPDDGTADGNGSVTRAFGVRGYPAYALVGPDGVVGSSGFALTDLRPLAAA